MTIPALSSMLTFRGKRVYIKCGNLVITPPVSGGPDEAAQRQRIMEMTGYSWEELLEQHNADKKYYYKPLFLKRWLSALLKRVRSNKSN